MDTISRATAPVWGEGVAIPSPLWPPDSRFDDVVVGGGFTGLTTALLLARAGRSVALLEARHIGAGASGSTTGKLSLLQGTKLSRILEVHSAQVAQAYVDANREGQAWLLEFCATHDLSVQRRDAVTYAATTRQVPAVRRECEAARSLGLGAVWRDLLAVPFPVRGAVVLPDQAQFDPRELLVGLATQLHLHGGRIYEGTRVTGVSKLGEPVVSTEDGRSVHCSDVILATGAPILNRGLYFAKLEARRSYLLAFAIDGDGPEQMLISAGAPTRSIRGVPGEDPRLLVGGDGHVVARGGSELAHLQHLRDWTGEHYPGAVETHAWAAQDHTSHDGIPYVGHLPRGLGRVYVATGYDKWGLTNSVAAARTISGQILGASPSWAKPLGRRITHPKAALALVERNLRAGGATAAQLVRAEMRGVDPAEGSGTVGRQGLNPMPVGVTTSDGTARRVAGLCTHLGGTLHWNDAENTWDCPWHGSRFAADGTVLDGPATRPLTHEPSE